MGVRTGQRVVMLGKFIRDECLQAKLYPIIVLLLYSTLSISVASSPLPQVGKDGLEGVGIECVVSEIKYERDSIPKYFVFEGGEVYRLSATKGIPAYIEKFSQGQYFESDEQVRWYPYILDRETLRLSKLRPSYHSREHNCVLMDLESIEVILQKKIDEFDGK